VEFTLVSVHPGRSLWRDEVSGPVVSMTRVGGFSGGASALRFYTRIKTATMRYA
jgi:hypothetical protein